MARQRALQRTKIRDRLYAMLRMNGGVLRPALKKLKIDKGQYYYEREVDKRFANTIDKNIEKGQQAYDKQLIEATIEIKDKLIASAIAADIDVTKPMEVVAILRELNRQHENIQKITDNRTQNVTINNSFDPSKLTAEELEIMIKLKEKATIEPGEDIDEGVLLGVLNGKSDKVES